QAHQLHRMTGHGQLDPQQGAVGGPEDQDVVLLAHVLLLQGYKRKSGKSQADASRASTGIRWFGRTLDGGLKVGAARTGRAGRRPGPGGATRRVLRPAERLVLRAMLLIFVSTAKETDYIRSCTDVTNHRPAPAGPPRTGIRARLG